MPVKPVKSFPICWRVRRGFGARVVGLKVRVYGAGGGNRTPTGLPLLDFESAPSITRQHISQHITQNQKTSLSRVASYCLPDVKRLGTKQAQFTGTGRAQAEKKPTVLGRYKGALDIQSKGTIRI